MFPFIRVRHLPLITPLSHEDIMNFIAHCSDAPYYVLDSGSLNLLVPVLLVTLISQSLPLLVVFKVIDGKMTDFCFTARWYKRCEWGARNTPNRYHDKCTEYVRQPIMKRLNNEIEGGGVSR